jgi:type I restriction enzyme M protein
MIGAIIGDIIGSPYEFTSDKSKDFPLFISSCRPTDDSVLTIAVGMALIECDINDEYSFKRELSRKLKEIGLAYPDSGYGGRFYQWMIMDEDEAYGGDTNGSAMRVSPVAYAADSLDTALTLAKWSAEITHSHPDGIRGAQSVAAAVYLARTGASKEEIREYITQNFYDLDFTIDQIRPGYRHDMTCEGSVPQAIACFLEAEDYEDAVRNAISLGGDGDTIACIAGGIAGAYFGVPEEIENEAISYLDDGLRELYYQICQELCE